MPAKRKVKKKAKKPAPWEREIAGIIFVALACLLMASLLFSSPGEGGAASGFLLRFMQVVAGQVAWLLPLFIFIFGLLLFLNRHAVLWKGRFAGFLLAFCSILSLIHLRLPRIPFAKYIESGWLGQGGGLFGAFFSYFLRLLFGQLGSIIIFTALAIIGLILLTNVSLRSLFGKIAALFAALGDVLRPEKEAKQVKAAPAKKVKTGLPEGPPIIISHEEGPAAPLITEAPGADRPVISPDPTIFSQEYLPQIRKNNREEPEPAAQEEYIIPMDQSEIIPWELPAEDLLEEPREYILPSPELLPLGLKVKNPRANKELTDSVGVLEKTLESFGVNAKVTQVVAGPSVTRFELQPAPGVKVSKITSLSDDIALSLAATDVRIEAPIPGRSVVGIEVPRRETATVHFRDIVESPDFLNSPSLLSFGLGKNIGGDTIVGDLAKMPHLLIAGSTGSGKSICLNTIICSILYKAKPDQVKLMLIDPKKVEMTNYQNLPHLLTKVVTDVKEAAASLKGVVKEMERRYSLFADNGVRDFTRYNEKKKEEPEEVLPQIVVIIDELADLMLVAPDDVEEAICRIAQMARAAGIHMVVATQRPSVDVITGLIKANIPSRVAFAVSSYTDSRTIIDMAGADKLLGRGDMLYLPLGINRPLRIQGSYIDEKDIQKLVKYCADQAIPRFSQEFVNSVADEVKVVEDDGEDALFWEAAQLVIRTGQASASFLQRRLRIGNPRASRLIDILEQKGIVSGPEGSKPRRVLVSMEQLENIFGVGRSLESGV
ncbi:MAG: DNA translocase FtsK [Clostridiales bacterium]|nr:DNA translocase FtsK [Clostridiales bacterium]